MLICDTSELTGQDLWSSNMATFRTSVITVLLSYFTYLHESNQKLRYFHTRYKVGLCIDIAANITKIAIKILQGTAGT